MSALRRREVTQPAALEARVSNPDPDDLTVTIEEFDGAEFTRHAWPVVAWPRSAAAVPARGDRCLVVMSEVGGAWVVAAEWTGDALSWTAFNLTGSDWAAVPEAFAPGYAKSQTGWVTLRGILAKGRSPETGELLPDPLPRTCWPPKRRSFVALAGGGVAALVHVRTDGRVALGTIPSPAPAGATVTLDGIAYQAED